MDDLIVYYYNLIPQIISTQSSHPTIILDDFFTLSKIHNQFSYVDFHQLLTTFWDD